MKKIIFFPVKLKLFISNLIQMYSRNMRLPKLLPQDVFVFQPPQFFHRQICENKINTGNNAFQTLNPGRKLHISSSVGKFFGTLNPFKALDTWLDFEKLRREWDPKFTLTDFKVGAKQALCTSVNLIQQNSWQNLRGLICAPLIEELQKDPEKLKKLEETGSLTVKRIASTDLSRLSLQEIVDKKYCDIDVSFKIREIDGENHLTHRYILRLHREYTKGKLPQWTIVKLGVERIPM